MRRARPRSFRRAQEFKRFRQPSHGHDVVDQQVVVDRGDRPELARLEVDQDQGCILRSEQVVRYRVPSMGPGFEAAVHPPSMNVRACR